MSFLGKSFAISTTYPKIVTNGLVLNLDAGQQNSYPGSGTTWTDLSGNGNTGTLTNGPTYSSANGGSIVFDGVDDKVTLTASSQFAYGTGDFAVEGWFFCTKTLPNFGERLFSQTVSGTNYFVVNIGTDVISPGQKVTFIFATSGGGTQVNSSNTWEYDTWNHLTVSRISGSVIVYLNTIGGTPTACNQNFNNTTYVPTIGQYTHTNSNGFGGRISALRVYMGKGLTATEVSQNYNALRSRYGI
jgi:hypothetical protein